LLPVTVVRGDTVDAAFAVTSDGGNTWTTAAEVKAGAATGQILPPGSGQLTAAAASPSVWWVVAYTSEGLRVWVTENGGTSFVSRSASGVPAQTTVPVTVRGASGTLVASRLFDLKAS